MKIFVRVKPGAKAERVSQMDAGHFSISVKEPPREGRANEAVRKALAEHLGIPRSRIALVSGATASDKVFDVS